MHDLLIYRTYYFTIFPPSSQESDGNSPSLPPCAKAERREIIGQYTHRNSSVLSAFFPQKGSKHPSIPCAPAQGGGFLLLHFYYNTSDFYNPTASDCFFHFCFLFGISFVSPFFACSVVFFISFSFAEGQNLPLVAPTLRRGRKIWAFFTES